MRVNRRTEAIDRVRDPDEALDEVLGKEVKTISLRQLEIAIMTEQIIERSATTPGAQ
jgi:hypothetical protein